MYYFRCGDMSEALAHEEKKSFCFHFLNKVVQTLPAVGFQRSINKHPLNQLKNQVWSLLTKEWLRYRQIIPEPENRATYLRLFHETRSRLLVVGPKIGRFYANAGYH